MLEDFSFKWNGKRWYGFINALSTEQIRVHFEEYELRELFKGSLIIKLEGHKLLFYQNKASILEKHSPLCSIILQAVAQRLNVNRITA